MPPKKKKGKKGKKKKKDDGELTVDDKYKKTLDEIESLKDHLAFRKELTRRSQAQGDEWREHAEQAQAQLDEQKETCKDISAEMTRQYKTLQTEMQLRVYQLENELARTRAQLDKTESDLKKTTEEKERMEKEKDTEIEDLRHKIDAMGMNYEAVFNDALDKLIEKIDGAKGRWEDKSTMIQAQNKQTLLEFGLNPLDL